MFDKYNKKMKEMSPVEKDAKMSVVKAMKKMAEDQMAGKLKGLKKVTVAAPDEEGLKEGLEKAEEIVEGQEDMMEAEECEMEEMSSEEPMSEEELDMKIQELLKMKEQLKK